MHVTAAPNEGLPAADSECWHCMSAAQAQQLLYLPPVWLLQSCLVYLIILTSFILIKKKITSPPPHVCVCLCVSLLPPCVPAQSHSGIQAWLSSQIQSLDCFSLLCSIPSPSPLSLPTSFLNKLRWHIQPQGNFMHALLGTPNRLAPSRPLLSSGLRYLVACLTVTRKCSTGI